ncbi:MAG: GFA family protein [Deltaproteobacteria bacterium]|nr:GFA family protein [Deltaproteobacteria bacterium]MBW2362575.1 GFA family protein [Deltaproteobacteria bacterium]
MADEKVPGACLCGAVRFRVALPSLFCGHCHCSMCRRNHGAGFVTWFGVPRAQLSLEPDSARLQRYASSEHGVRSFCGQCGSSLFCESAQHPERIDIVLANIEGPIDRPPGFHCYFDHGADWVEVHDGLPRLGGPSGIEPLDGDA